MTKYQRAYREASRYVNLEAQKDIFNHKKYYRLEVKGFDEFGYFPGNISSITIGDYRIQKSKAIAHKKAVAATILKYYDEYFEDK